MEEFMKIPPLDMNMDTEVVESEDTQNQGLLLVPNTSELLPCSSRETVPELLPCSSRETVPEVRKQLDNVIDKALYDPPTGKCDITPTSGSKKWDVTSRRYLKSRKHPSLIANTPKKNIFNELTQAKLELVELQKGLLEAEIVEKKKVWEFEEKERAKESQFREKERQWKKEEYRLKLEKIRK